MLRVIALSISVIAASAATAQPVDPSAAPGAPSGPAASAPAPAADPTQSPSAAAPAADPSAAASSSPVASFIETGFPKYDKDGSGTLSAAEFKTWISDLKTQELTAEGKAADPAAAKQYASTALKAADKDKDGKVSKDELTAFLSG